MTARRAYILARARDRRLGVHARWIYIGKQREEYVEALPWSSASSTKNPIVAGTRRSSIVAVQSTTLTSMSGAMDDMAALNSFSVNMKAGSRRATLSSRQSAGTCAYNKIAYLRRSTNRMMGTPSLGSNPEISTTSPRRYRHRPSWVVSTTSYCIPSSTSHCNTSQRGVPSREYRTYRLCEGTN